MTCRRALLLALVAALSPLPAGAGGLPLWELGVGAGGVVLPHYRGAQSVTAYALPFPFVQYHGERLQVDEEGVHGLLFRSPRLEADVSLAGGVPVPEDADTARRGMPSLDPTVEIGPSLDIRLGPLKPRGHALWLRLPVRAALAFDRKHVDHAGWVFSPYVEYLKFNGRHSGPWSFSLSLGPLFGDKSYHEYFYEVAATHASAARPEYHPAAGYAGSRVTLAMQKRTRGYWIGVFARLDSLSGATFSDSPLMEQEFYFATGIAVAKIIASAKDPARRQRGH